MTMATGTCEWSLLLLSEALDGRTFLQSVWETARKRTCLIATDCKSLFDHVQSQSAPTLDDRRTALDIIILREPLAKMQGWFRWLPTDRMIADALTKESPEASDLIRACMRTGMYQKSLQKRLCANGALTSESVASSERRLCRRPCAEKVRQTRVRTAFGV